MKKAAHESTKNRPAESPGLKTSNKAVFVFALILGVLWGWVIIADRVHDRSALGSYAGVIVENAGTALGASLAVDENGDIAYYEIIDTDMGRELAHQIGKQVSVTGIAGEDEEKGRWIKIKSWRN